MADEVKLSIEAEDQASDKFRDIMQAIRILVSQAVKDTNRLAEAQKFLAGATEDPSKVASAALKNAVEWRKQEIKYANKLKDAQDTLNDELEQYVKVLSRVAKLRGQDPNIIKKQMAGLTVSVSGTKDLKQITEFTKQLSKNKKEQIAVEKQLNKQIEESVKLRKQGQRLAENTGLKIQRRETERLSESVRRLSNNHQKQLSDTKFLKAAINRYSNAAKEAGIDTKILSKWIDQLANGAKKARLQIKKTKDDLNDKKKVLRDMVQDISKVNVQYFTFTNILHDIEFGVERVAQVMTRMMRSIIDAGGEMEKFERTVAATESTYMAGQQRINEIIELGLDLVGLQTSAMIKYNSQMRAAGLTSKQVDTILTGVARSMSELGKGTEASERVLLQLNQALTGNKIVMQDLRPILEETPRFWQAATVAMGQVVRDTEKFRDVIKDKGIDPRQGLIATMEVLNKYATGADMTTYAAQIDILKDRFFLLQAEIGKSVLPVIIYFIELLNNLIKLFNQAPKAVKIFVGFGLLTITAALVTINATLKISMALIALFHLRLAAGVVAKYASSLGNLGKALNSVIAGFSAVNKVLAFGGRFLKFAGWIGIAVTALSALIWTIDKFTKKSSKDMVDALNEIAKAQHEVNRNLLQENALLMLSEGFKEQIEEIKKGGKELSKAQRQIINAMRDEMRFIAALTSGDEAKIQEAVSKRTQQIARDVEALQFRLENIPRRGTKAARKAFRELTQEMNKKSLALETLGLAFDFWMSQTEDAKNAAENFKVALVELSWALHGAEDLFKRAESNKQIADAAEQLTLTLKNQLNKQFKDEELTKSERLDMMLEYYAKLGDINEEAMKRMGENTFETIGKLKELLKEDVENEHKKVHERMTTRIKSHNARWIQTVKDSTEKIKAEYKALGEVLKENAEKYSPEKLLDFSLFGKGSGGFGDQGILGMFKSAFQIDDAKKRMERLQSLASMFNARLLRDTELTEEHKAEIISKFHEQIKSLLQDRYDAEVTYLKSIKDHHVRLWNELVDGWKGVYNIIKGYSLGKIAEIDLEIKGSLWRFGKFIDDIKEPYKKHLEDTEKQNKDYAKRIERVHRRLAKNMADLLINTIFEGGKNFKEAALNFIKSSLKIIAQHYIETEIRISNEKRVQSEVAKTQAMQMKGVQSLISNLGGGGILGLIKSSLTGGGVAAAGAGAAFPTEMGNLTSGIGGLLKQIETIPNKVFGNTVLESN